MKVKLWNTQPEVYVSIEVRSHKQYLTVSEELAFRFCNSLSPAPRYYYNKSYKYYNICKCGLIFFTGIAPLKFTFPSSQ